MSTTSVPSVCVVATEPFEGQMPGTSGLRKKVKVFMQKHYTENFVQCILDALRTTPTTSDNSTVCDKLTGCTLIVGGDGRYFSTQAINIIIRMAAANCVGKLIIGQRGILSTPAVSALIRRRRLANGGGGGGGADATRVVGGIVLTASHNPGGIQHDFGIKFNVENGGPAPDSFTDRVYQLSAVIRQYRITPDLYCDFQQVGQHVYFVDDRQFCVEVVDSTADYVELMRTIFDFEQLRSLIRGGGGDGDHDKQKGPQEAAAAAPFNVLIDAMNGVTGVYVRQIFVEELGASADRNVRRIIPLDNFGEIHPDPNLTYAADLVERVRDDPSRYDFGAAFDGDGDRNMVLGRGAFFVTPSDSLAVIANNLQCIPYFRQKGVHGFARSMPTAAAVDRVAEHLQKEMFEVPTGWKYFGNLMDAGRLSLCGEESFGTGSDHIREKDGIWAVLAWLSIIAHKRMGVEDILKEHWRQYGRNYFTRYDYEECDSVQALQMMRHLQALIADGQLNGTKHTSATKCYEVRCADNFSYKDPIDGSTATNQGIRLLFTDGSRVIYRLSGTGSSGATVRVYIDSYEKDDVMADAQVMLKPLVDLALKLSKLSEFTGRIAPTVIT